MSKVTIVFAFILLSSCKDCFIKDNKPKINDKNNEHFEKLEQESEEKFNKLSQKAKDDLSFFSTDEGYKELCDFISSLDNIIHKKDKSDFENSIFSIPIFADYKKSYTDKGIKPEYINLKFLCLNKNLEDVKNDTKNQKALKELSDNANKNVEIYNIKDQFFKNDMKKYIDEKNNKSIALEKLSLITIENNEFDKYKSGLKSLFTETIEQDGKLVLSKSAQLVIAELLNNKVNIYKNIILSQLADDVFFNMLEDLSKDENKTSILESLTTFLAYNKTISFINLVNYYSSITIFADFSEESKTAYATLLLSKAALDNTDKPTIEKNKSINDLLKLGLEAIKLDTYFTQEQKDKINAYAQSVGLI